ncbi:hypothetical protein [Wenyingzhuangia sp. IMCC45574]
MKSIILFFNIIALFSCNNGVKKDYFEVIEGQRILFQTVNDNNQIYYKISQKGNQELLLYPINTSTYSDEEKLQMIEELLSFKDDYRICSNAISNYNPKLSKIYRGKAKDYSIQLEALFLINQIFFDTPFNYSPIPVLIDRETKKEETIKGQIIEKAYQNYEKWFENIRKIGFDKARKEKVYPLSKSKISWLYSIAN